MTGTLPPSSSPPSPTASTPAVIAGGLTPMKAILASIVAVQIVSGSLQSFLGPLFHTLSESLGVTAAQLNWVSIANLLSSAVFAPVLARMGDLYGHRRILRANLLIIMVGSLLVAVARNFEVLLTGQVLQGSLSGLFPLLVGILRNHSGGEENRRGIGLMIAGLGIGSGLGLVSSGLVVEWADDPTKALWVPVFTVAVAVSVAYFFLPETDDRPGGSIDWAGGTLLGAGLVGVLLALGQGQAWGWTALSTLAWGIGGLAALVAWTVVELRHPEPMVDVRMFAKPQVVVVSAVALAFSFILFGLTVAGSIFMSLPPDQVGFGLGLSALNIAFASLPAIVGMTLGSVLAPHIARVIGDRFLLALGCVLLAVAYTSIALFHGSVGEYLTGTAVSGLGMGLLQQSTRTIAVEAVSKEETAVGSGINELMLTVGGSLGAAVVGVVFTAHTATGGMFPDEGGFTTAWWVCAGVGLAGALIALLYRARPVGTTQNNGTTQNTEKIA